MSRGDTIHAEAAKKQKELEEMLKQAEGAKEKAEG
jgi:hypothetical protein